MKQHHNEIIVMSRSMPFHGIGGMEIVAWDLCREFARRGKNVRVVTTAEPGHREPFEEDGVTVVPLSGTPAGRYSRKWWRASKDYFQAECLSSASVVLSISAGAYGLLKIKNFEIPIVMQAHGTSWGRFSQNGAVVSQGRLLHRCVILQICQRTFSTTAKSMPLWLLASECITTLAACHQIYLLLMKSCI